MSLNFAEMEAFLVSRGYRMHPKGKGEHSVGLFQKRARSTDDPNGNDLFFNFDLYEQSDTGSRTLSGWIQVYRERWTLDIETFSFFASEIDTLLDQIEAEWFAIADLPIAINGGKFKCA